MSIIPPIEKAGPRTLRLRLSTVLLILLGGVMFGEAMEWLRLVVKTGADPALSHYALWLLPPCAVLLWAGSRVAKDQAKITEAP